MRTKRPGEDAHGVLHPLPWTIEYRVVFPHVNADCRCCHREAAWCEFEIRKGSDWLLLCLDCADFISGSLFDLERTAQVVR